MLLPARSLVDACSMAPARTPPLQAGLIGAVTSVLAAALFSPAFVIFLRATSVRSSNVLSYLLLTILTGVFSFLGVGWALLLVSVGVGWGLYRLAA
jgi:hypothetical protein